MLLSALAFTVLAQTASVPRSKMPNLNQMDYSDIPGGGKRSCCPTASADGLLWLAQNGFTDLVPASVAEKDKASWMVHELAKYYKTDEQIGTPWDRMFTGLPLFLKDR